MNTPLSTAEQSLKPSFTLSEVHGRAWVLTKKYWKQAVALGLIGVAVIFPLEGIRIALQPNAMASGEMHLGAGLISMAIGLLSLVVQMHFAIALTRYALAVIEEKPQSLKEYLAFNRKMLVSIVVASFLYGLAALAGFITLVFPGVIISIALSMYSYLIVEKQVGAIDALKQSWSITKKNRWNIFLFGVLIMVSAMVIGFVPAFIATMTSGMWSDNNALLIVVGIVSGAWLLGFGAAVSIYYMLASTVMYKAMLATRKV